MFPEITFRAPTITHDGTGIFEGLESPLRATRYHSLIVERASLPDCLEINATCAATCDDGDEPDLIMGFRHRELPVFGVQFHPESIASQSGHALLANFLTIATGREIDEIPELERVEA